jgi:hypothetical protein
MGWYPVEIDGHLYRVDLRDPAPPPAEGETITVRLILPEEDD